MRSVVFAFFPFLCATLWAQDTLQQKGNIPYLQLRVSPYGFILPHSRELIDVSTSRPWGAEISYGWLQNSPEKLSRNGIYAKRGFSFAYYNYNRPSILGSSLMLSTYVEPLFLSQKSVFFSLPMSLGLCYLTRVYDAQTNPTNLFFSSPLSFYLMLGFQSNIKINSLWEVSWGLNYCHISNGGIKKPNKGMNFPMFSLSTTRNIRPVSYHKIPTRRLDTIYFKPYSFAHFIHFSIKNTPETEQHPTEPAMIISTFHRVKKKLKSRTSIEAGTEIIYDGYARTLKSRVGERVSPMLYTLCMGMEFTFGSVVFSPYLGAYIYHPTREHDIIYQRFALTYKYKKLLVGGTLRSHRHVAEVLEFRLGFEW